MFFFHVVQYCHMDHCIPITLQFLGFCHDSAPKPKPNEPKRLISCKTSVFRNRSGKQAQYIL